MINKTGIAARIGLATACLVALLAAPAGRLCRRAGGSSHRSPCRRRVP